PLGSRPGALPGHTCGPCGFTLRRPDVPAATGWWYWWYNTYRWDHGCRIADAPTLRLHRAAGTRAQHGVIWGEHNDCPGAVPATGTPDRSEQSTGLDGPQPQPR